MTDTVIPFPLTRPSRHRMAKLGEAWLAEADRRLIAYTWMWSDGSPGWVGDGWAKFICEYREAGLMIAPETASWPELWAHFVAVWLAYQPEWRRAVEIACAEIEGEAA